MDLYFQRHDGMAVTCDDFRAAMSDANGVDLLQFERWYSQAGTPVVECSGEYDAEAKTYTLRLRQGCPSAPGQAPKLPYVIPFAVGLVDSTGYDLPLELANGGPLRVEREPNGATTAILPLVEAEQRFVFGNVPEKPVPSLLRGFSAPVHVRNEHSDEELGLLMAHDLDSFNRWEASQLLATRVLLAGAETIRAARDFTVPALFSDAIGRVLTDGARDPGFAAECLQLPSENYLAECSDCAYPDAIHSARQKAIREIATRYRTRFEGAFRHFSVPGPYSPDATAMGRRALRNTALGYITSIDDATSRALAFLELRRAANMTDAMAALVCLSDSAGAERERALAMFYDKWKDEALVIDKWFYVQATAALPGTLGRVKALMAHPAFDLKNPNRARSLLHAFAMSNPLHFHAADGSGYGFIAEQVIALDRLNPQVASRLARAFDRWKKYDEGRQAHARAALESIRAAGDISGNVEEVVDHALA
jgi:aminopeptidase N